MFKRLTHPDNPPARNGCTCSCHTSMAKVKHVRACCPRETVVRGLDQYQLLAKGTVLMESREVFFKRPDGVLVPVPWVYSGLGLGEAGEIQNKLKKIIRDSNGEITPEIKEAIKGEIGGLLWYVAELSRTFGLTLSDVATYNISQLESRQARGKLKGSGDNR